ncbi:hypothetical protein BGW80DRAFT_177149 [Lactifluus volemus]|nr:hypothetical protein BGW80DRAFT_177149 [Lactifluus volemus]
MTTDITLTRELPTLRVWAVLRLSSGIVLHSLLDPRCYLVTVYHYIPYVSLFPYLTGHGYFFRIADLFVPLRFGLIAVARRKPRYFPFLRVTLPFEREQCDETRDDILRAHESLSILFLLTTSRLCIIVLAKFLAPPYFRERPSSGRIPHSSWNYTPATISLCHKEVTACLNFLF